MKRFAVVLTVLLLTFIFFGIGNVFAQTIHFILISDTADKTLGELCQATAQRMEATLSDLIPEGQFDFSGMGTKEDTNGVITAKNTEWYLKELRKVVEAGEINKNDTLVFMYEGHGGRGILGDHYVKLSNGEWMYSSRLQELVNAIPCRLKVIMTSSCNTSWLDVFFGQFSAEDWNAKQNGIAPVMESLFLDHKGLVHMNSARPGNYGYSNWFFDVFLTHCQLNPRSRPSWKDIDKMLDKKLTERFEEAKKQGRISRKHGNLLSHQKNANIITWSFGERR